MSEGGPPLPESTKLPLALTISRAQQLTIVGRIGSTGRQSSTNSWFAGLLVAVVSLAPIPLASDRPAFWLGWATIVGLLGLAYWVATTRRTLHVSLGNFQTETALFLLLCGFLLFQILPITRWLPPQLLVANQAPLVAPTISLMPGPTWLEFLNFLTFGALFFLFAQVTANRRRARVVLYALFLMVASFAIYGLVALTQLGDTTLGFEKSKYLGFATGTFVNRNSFATFLSSGLAIGAALLIDRVATPDRPARMLQFVTLGLGMTFISVALFATQSRMGLAAGIGGSLAVLLLGFSALRVRGRIVLVIGVCLLLVFVTVATLFGSGVIERLILTSDEAGRGELYRQIWAAISLRPWLGYGGGGFLTIFPVFQHAPLTGEYVWNLAHSTYLALWFELGLVAGSIPLLIIAILAFRTLRSLREPANRAPGLAALGVTIVFVIHSLVDFSAEIEANSFLFTAVLAIGAAGAVLRGGSDAMASAT